MLLPTRKRPTRPRRRLPAIEVRWSGNACRLRPAMKVEGVVVPGPTRDNQEAEQTPVAFGARLRAFREARGLSQQPLPEAMGDVDQTKVSRWERGASGPDVFELIRLAKALKVQPEILIDHRLVEVDELPQQVAAEVWRAVRTIQKLIRPYRSSRQGAPSAERRAPAEP